MTYALFTQIIITVFTKQTRKVISLVCTDDSYRYLESRTSKKIQWKHPLLSQPNSLEISITLKFQDHIICRMFHYIEFIEFKGLQPYAPVCVLQQFGQPKVFSLRENLRVFEISFESNFEVSRTIDFLHKWNKILMLDIVNGQKKEILVYQFCSRKDHNSMCREGEHDLRMLGQQ